MADLYEQGIDFPYDSVNAQTILPDVYGVGINWFSDRIPLLHNLPKLPTGGLSFLLTNDNYRPRSALLGTALTDTTGTSVSVPDGSIFDVGDVLEIDSEAFLVTAVAPGAGSAGTLTVTRGFAGSTAATHLINTPVYILTNARSGGAININAIDRKPSTVEQYLQTVMHAYQIAGSLESATNYVSGLGTPMNRAKMLCMQHCLDDFESGMYYGKGAKLASQGGTPSQKGLRTLINTNNVQSPTNAGAYKPSDLIRDAIQPAYDGGGKPGLLLVSTNFMTGLSIWGEKALRIAVGETKFGTSISAFSVSFLPDLLIMTAPLLKPGTLIGLSLNEVRVRVKRALFDKPRGSQGDATQGDMIMEGAIELDNETHHTYVSGITAFSAS